METNRKTSKFGLKCQIENVFMCIFQMLGIYDWTPDLSQYILFIVVAVSLFRWVEKNG